MPHDTGREVLWGARTLTLSDEPLAGAVEHRAFELRELPPEERVPLDHLVYGHRRKQPALGRQGSIQQVL